MKKIVLIILVLVFTLMGCGKDKTNEKDNKEKEPELTMEEQNIENAKNTVKELFENLSGLNFQEAKNYVDIDRVESFIDSELGYMSGDQFMNEWFDTLKCEIISAETIDDSTVNVYGKVTVRDMTELLLKNDEVFNNYIKENVKTLALYNEEQRTEIFKKKSTEIFRECVKDETYSTNTLSITFDVSNIDGQWYVNVDNDFLNVIMGDYIGAMEALGFSVVQ